MSKVKSLVAAALTLAAVGTAANADVLTLSTKLVSTFAAGVSTGGTTVNSSTFTVPAAQQGVLRDYVFEIDGQASAVPAGFSYGDSLFDITYTATGTGAVTRPSAPNIYNYSGNSPIFIDDGSGPGNGDGAPHTLFSTNADKGTSNTDLVAITNVIDNNPDTDGTFGADTADTRGSAGIASGLKLGTIRLQWNGLGTLTFTTTNAQFADLNDTTLQYGSTNGNTVVSTPTVLTGGTGAPSPEPASLGVLALGGIALLNRRRKA